jgi:hypothetical protein
MPDGVPREPLRAARTASGGLSKTGEPLAKEVGLFVHLMNPSGLSLCWAERYLLTEVLNSATAPTRF